MNQDFKQHSHCSYCGTHFTEQVLWPRKCFRCYNDSFSNPLPVVVAMIDVWEGDKVGTLIQQRGIEPKKDQWALTGGYMNSGETWQEAIAREVEEELGLVSKPEEYRLFDIQSSTSKSQILIFSFHKWPVKREDIKFVPNEEVKDIKIIFESMELAFPSHTDILKHYAELMRETWAK